MSVSKENDKDPGYAVSGIMAGSIKAINPVEAANVLEGLFRNEKISIAVVQGRPSRIVLVNKGMSMLTGYSEEELLGFGAREQANLIHPDFREAPRLRTLRDPDQGRRSGWCPDERRAREREPVRHAPLP